MNRHDTDRNLLFGITALQNDFITRDALIASMNAWALEKHRSLGEILVERGELELGDRDALEAMIARRLAKHGDDPTRSLAALGAASGLAADLRRSIADPEVLASIAHVADDPHATRLPDTADFVPAAARYRKVRDHARGGLGIVYVALDEELRREVALKEIKPEYAHNLASQSRFLLEAEITGGLEHPGIVPVYGLGHYDDGRPFYAMRFIKGDSLKDAIAAFHADPALKRDPGARTLALQKLLRRFLDVCNAVAYAHSRGVLHRDLKPDNVMVGRYGETLVVDWGLAKVAGRSDGEDASPLPETTLQPASASGSAETLPGSVIGTPAYMSPEQAAGRLDLLGPASDVYSLGATLYTLLTGRVPFAGKDLAEVLRKVEQGEFPRPRESAPWLDPALEAVTLKAMALRPDARYPSPKALADDLERWLADEPVAARREPLTRRARRWTRKHRTAVTTAASTSLVAALLIGVYAWTILDRARRADAAGLATLAQVEFLEADARKTDDPARWSEAIAEARRAEVQLESGSDAAKSRARVKLSSLQQALRVLERDRKMVADLDEARLLGSNVKDGHFDGEAMANAILTAFRTYGIDLTVLPPEEAASRIRASRIGMELVAALDEVCPVFAKPWPDRLAAVSRLADADPRSIDIRERIALKDFEGLRRLVAEEATRRELGARCRTIFTTLSTLDPTASLLVLEAIHHEKRADFWLTHGLARACQDAKLPRLESAVRYYYAAAALRPTSAGVFLNLGSALKSGGDLDAAIIAYRDAIRLKPDYAEAHDHLGHALQSKRDFDGAIAAFREAVRLKPDIAMAHFNLGQALQSKGDFDAAIAAYRESIRLNPVFAEAHSNLGLALAYQGDIDAAIAAYRESIRLNPVFAEAHSNLGLALASQGDIDAAIAAYRESIRLKPDLAEAHVGLGMALYSKRRFAEAVAASRESLRLKPDNALAHFNLGLALSSTGESDAAIASFRDSIRLKPDFAEAYCNLASILKERGLFVEAFGLFEKGHALGSKQAKWPYPSTQWVADCRRLVELEPNLPALMKGEAKPKDADDGLVVAGLCSKKEWHAASARIYAGAFAERPTLADDQASGHRYNAACAASLAGSGAGKDDPPLNEAGRAKLRDQAREWLRADLAGWAKVLEGRDAKTRLRVVAKLFHRKVDPDLAGIRDEEGLSKLPEAERQAWRALWADVEALRQKAAGR